MSLPKSWFLYVAAIALLGTGLPWASAQTSVPITDPVGLITLNVAGSGSTSQTAMTFVGLGLTRTVVFDGAATAVGANALVVNSAPFTQDEFDGAAGAFNVEITSGPAAGVTLDIQSTTSSTITTAQPLLSRVAAGVTFKVRSHWTIASAFGPNAESGLQKGRSRRRTRFLSITTTRAAIAPTIIRSSGLEGSGGALREHLLWTPARRSFIRMKG